VLCEPLGTVLYRGVQADSEAFVRGVEAKE
jgi:hypothetical protein